MPGGVNNFWSYMNVHYKQKGKMKAQLILLLDSINAGETLEVMVSATDLVDTPLPGAWVKLTNTYSDEIYTNYTDVTGHWTTKPKMKSKRSTKIPALSFG